MLFLHFTSFHVLSHLFYLFPKISSPFTLLIIMWCYIIPHFTSLCIQFLLFISLLIYVAYVQSVISTGVLNSSIIFYYRWRNSSPHFYIKFVQTCHMQTNILHFFAQHIRTVQLIIIVKWKICKILLFVEIDIFENVAVNFECELCSVLIKLLFLNIKLLLRNIFSYWLWSIFDQILLLYKFFLFYI